jgi:hypothetical protein
MARVTAGLNGCSNEFYIENVLEELTSPREWFFDRVTRTLYYFHAGTEPIASLKFEAASLKELIRVVGTQRAPVRGVSLKGFGLKDTAYTYMDPHEMASGGDWTIVRQVDIRPPLFTVLDFHLFRTFCISSLPVSF